MKLKKRGKWLAFYSDLVVLSATGIVIAALMRWHVAIFVCIAVLVIALVLSLSLSLDANVDEYGLFGIRQGPDTLIEYEPGDKEYDEEKYWQESEDDTD